MSNGFYDRLQVNSDEEKNKAAVSLASIALTRDDPSCGLSEVLEALSLEEDVKVIRKIEP